MTALPLMMMRLEMARLEDEEGGVEAGPKQGNGELRWQKSFEERC